MPPPARRAAPPPAGGPGPDAPDVEAPPDAPLEAPLEAPLVARLDAAEEAGDVDARQLADLLGVTAGGLRVALARPSALTADQAALVARALGVDAATMRALRRAEPGAPRPDRDPAASHHAGGHGAGGHGAHGAPAAAAGSTLALLDGVLRAVRPDATGLALRGAVLDACEAAARAAGRALPPGVHALRSGLAGPPGHDRPPAPDDESAGTADDAGRAPGAATEDAALVAAAAAVVRELQRTAPGYDDLFAPLHDDALADLLARHALAVHAAPGVAAGTRFVLTPALVGRRRLVLAAAASPDQRRLVVRAALAHCAAGHGGEHEPLASPAPEPAARLADVAALADLIPFWQVADLRRRGRMGWGAIAAHVAEAARGIAGDWEGRRAEDRGRLRVALYRQAGL